MGTVDFCSHRVTDSSCVISQIGAARKSLGYFRDNIRAFTMSCNLSGFKLSASSSLLEYSNNCGIFFSCLDILSIHTDFVSPFLNSSLEKVLLTCQFIISISYRNNFPIDALLLRYVFKKLSML